MGVIGITIFCILLVAVCVMVFGGVSNEVKKVNDKEEKRNELISRFVKDFNHLDVGSYEYALPLSVLISKASIFYAEAGVGKIPSKSDWEQCVFSICKLSIQIKDLDSADRFYKKFLWYKDYYLDKKEGNVLTWESNKFYFKGFLDSVIYFSELT